MNGAIALPSVLNILATDKADFAPGTKYEYSNANYTILSAVIAKISGVDEATFLRHDVFGTLRMTSSGYGYAAQEEPGVAKPYEARTPFTPQSPISLDLYAGAGAVVSDAPDMAAWDVALIRDTLLDTASMRAMWTPGKLSNGEDVDYAMGFVLATMAGHREVWRNGLSPGAGGYCYNAIFPDDHLAVIVLSNGFDFRGVPELMVQRILAAYDPNAAASLLAATPPPATGEDAAVTARAKDWWHRLQTGTVDLRQVTATFAQRLTPSFLGQIQGDLSGMGAPTDWIYLGSQGALGSTIYRYWIRIDGIPHIWSIRLTPDGKIAGSQLQ